MRTALSGPAAFALAFLAGVLVVQYSPSLPGTGPLVAAAIAAAMAAPLLRSALPLVFVAGLALATWTAHAVLRDRLHPADEGEVVQIEGVVASVPLRSPERLQFDFAPDDRRLPSRVRLSWFDPRAELAPGERWAFSVKLRAPRGLANPGGFDAEQRAAIDRVGATGYVHDETEPRRVAAASGWPVQRSRAWLAGRIDAAVGESRANGLVQALAVGVQDAVPDDQWRLFRLTGITHLVAISGLHVTLFAVVVAAGVRAAFRLPVLGRLQRWRIPAEAGCGLAAAFAYSLLAGWSVPTQRTVLMVGVCACAHLLRRRVGSAPVLALALVVVLARDPLAAATAGFWLSFGAVAALVASTPGRLGALGTVRTFLVTQAAVTIALAPLTAALFGGLSWVGTLANVVAIPAYSFVAVPLVLGGTAVAPFVPELAALAWRLAAAFLDLGWPLLEWLVELPGVGWSPVPPGPGAFALGLGGVLVALSPVPAAARGLGAVLVGGMLAVRAERPPQGTAWVTVLDVGQGLAVAVETRRHVVVYDTGPKYRGGGSAGESVVVPFLRARGWRAVDLLVVSHADDDHSGGAPAVRDAVAVRAEASGERGAIDPCLAGAGWRFDGVELRFLHPSGERHDYSRNDGSCVLRVDAGGRRALLTGDITRAVEAELVGAAGDGPAADVVTVPHHGSRTSSSVEFVAATGARWAVVSAGWRNRWGFPKPDVVSRWSDADAQVVEVARSGATRFVLSPSGARTGRGERAERPRWWRAADPPPAEPAT